MLSSIHCLSKLFPKILWPCEKLTFLQLANAVMSCLSPDIRILGNKEPESTTSARAHFWQLEMQQADSSLACPLQDGSLQYHLLADTTSALMLHLA